MAATMLASMLLVDVPEHTLDLEMHDSDPDPERPYHDHVMGEAPSHHRRVQHELSCSTTTTTTTTAANGDTVARLQHRHARADSAVAVAFDHGAPANAPTAPRKHLSPAGPGLRRSRFARQPHREGKLEPKGAYPDHWSPQSERVSDLVASMAELDVQRERGGRGGGGGNPRKRRFREDDEAGFADERDRGRQGGYGRPQRRRYEEPMVARLRKGLLYIAESPMRSAQNEASELAKAIVASWDEPDVKNQMVDLAIQMCLEQPLKIPFVAGTILYANETNADVAAELLARAGEHAQEAVVAGQWRSFKLLLRLFACLQGVLEGEGIFPILEQLFSAAVDQQTQSQEDSLGLELVKIILLTLPYAIAASDGTLNDQATEFLNNTEVIASSQHPLESLVEPFHGEDEVKPFPFQSVIGLLQKQLQREAANGWTLSVIPRPYKPTEHGANGAQNGAENGAMNGEENGEENGDENGDAAEPEKPAAPSKHACPSIVIEGTPNPGPKPLFPEAYFSLYSDLKSKSVPAVDDVAASLIRDAMVDTINILDFNRNATAKFLIELDCFWAPETFARRATPFDKLAELPEGKSTWKPEDMAVDAIFSQMVALPTPEHKLVYYHSVVTETCKVAPAAIAPSLGRAIRFMFKHLGIMDMELSYRFMDWFAHHLSNFEFRWKWAEWLEDVARSSLDPKKAFIVSAIDKEIRLSFAKRIRETLPIEYHPLIPEGKEKDTPDFKYNFPQTPYAEEGQAIMQLMRKKASESEIQPIIDKIHTLATEQGVSDPLLASTDAYVTCICYVGSKSLSHVLSTIERCKERLLGLGSDAARRQVITSVVEYWKEQPGTAVNIVDKLLNYTIVSPEAVVGWALGQQGAGEQAQHGLGSGAGLADGWRYEMVAGTVGKVTNRTRQIVAARVQAKTQGLPDEQLAMLDDTLVREREAMRALFSLIDDAVGAVAAGASDGLIEAEGVQLSEDEATLIRGWGDRWGRVFRRKGAVEETVVSEMSVAVALAAAPEPQPEPEPEVQQEQAAADGAAEANGGAGEEGVANLVSDLDAAAAAAESAMDVA